MPPTPIAPRPRRSRRLLHLCLALAAASGAAAAVASYLDWAGRRDHLLADLEVHRLTPAEPDAPAPRSVLYERTAHHAELAAASELVQELFAAERLDSLPAASREGALARRVATLARARELASEALASQPNSWRATSLLGATTYLQWSLERDPRLFTESSAWEDPLLKSLRDAGQKTEPRRFLLIAYLELWRVLSEPKKTFAKELMAETFGNDREAFQRLIPIWLELAESPAEALEPIPDRPAAWQLLQEAYGEAERWRPYCRVREHRLDALEAELQGFLEEAEERLRLGDEKRGSYLLGIVFARAPVSARFLPMIRRAAELHPPPLRSLRGRRLPFQAWVEHCLELDSLGFEALPPPVLVRISTAVRDLPPQHAAHVALLAGEIDRAEREERVGQASDSEAWAAYWIAKSRWWIARERLAEAKGTLRRVPPSRRDRAAYLEARIALARAEGDPEALTRAERQLAGLRRRSWSTADWRWPGDRVVLDLLPAAAAGGLEVSFDEWPRGGAVVEIVWDGEEMEARPLFPGQTLRLRRRIAAEAHRLELRVLTGGQPYPGRVRLLDP